MAHRQVFLQPHNNYVGVMLGTAASVWSALVDGVDNHAYCMTKHKLVSAPKAE